MALDIVFQCPEIMLKSVQFYTSTAKHKQPATILSLMLPVFFSCTQDKGLEWLRENWNAVISYIHMYEKTYLHMHVSDDFTYYWFVSKLSYVMINEYACG